MALDQTRTFVRDPKHPTWNAHDSQMKALFGLDPKAKWPRQGMEPRTIQGIVVWVNSVDDTRITGNFHRVKARCPTCGKTFSAGRLHQHVCEDAGLDQGFIEAVYGPVLNVWQAIYPDATVDGNEEAIELCLDADRLTTFGEHVAGQLVQAQIDKHGFHKVREFMAQHIALV